LILGILDEASADRVAENGTLDEDLELTTTSVHNLDAIVGESKCHQCLIGRDDDILDGSTETGKEISASGRKLPDDEYHLQEKEKKREQNN
jgi:hypothetical protein